MRFYESCRFFFIFSGFVVLCGELCFLLFEIDPRKIALHAMSVLNSFWEFATELRSCAELQEPTCFLCVPCRQRSFDVIPPILL